MEEEVRIGKEDACDGGGERGLTVHGFALFLVDAVILRDEEVEVMVRMVDRADLVFVGDEVAGAESAVRSWLVVGKEGECLPQALQIRWELGVFGQRAAKTAEHLGLLCLSLCRRVD
jgi:hypothetical protein